MGLWTDVVGTVRGYIRLGLTGVRLKNSSGTLAVRNAGDSADANITCADLTLSGKLFGLNSVLAGGRLTLSSGVPVMNSGVSNSTSIYYTPYIHDKIPLYDGTNWAIYSFSELTNTTTDNTKNPAAVAADSNYDIFVWNDSGTIRLGRGPAWTSATARGTGAGTTELERVNGILVNKVSITNGPAAQRGTYVGTVRSDGSSTIDWELGGSAAGGDPAVLNVWNMYHRKAVHVQVRDTTDSWTYGTSSTWRAANNSATNRVSYVCGAAEDSITAYWHIQASGSVSGFAVCGIGVDSTTSASGITFRNGSSTVSPMAVAAYDGIPGLGSHYVSAVEYTDNGSTPVTFYGDGGTAYYLGGLRFMGQF